jgi:predicted lipoprotein with Yx(FWY)xxD motif
MIQTRKTGIGIVLTDAKGHTVYWFAKDTSMKSNCSDTCASYWRPVLGKAAPAAGVTLPQHFGSITRSGGEVQATYDGHPLYTYTADTSPGMTSGNGRSLSGALWWAMTPSGATLNATPAAAPTTTAPAPTTPAPAPTTPAPAPTVSTS